MALAVDGEEAVRLHREALAEGQPFLVALLDLTVRAGMGGQETARQLVELDPALKLLACSGYSNDPVMANCREYGFWGVVEKPYRSRDLGVAVSAALEAPPGGAAH